MDLFEAIHTQRSIRRFTGEDVSPQDVRTMLEAATKAPSATNAQPWAFIVVRGAAARRTIAEIYARAWELAKQFYGDPAKAADDAERRMLVATDRLAARLDDAPVLVLCCLDRSRLGALVTPDLQTLLDPASAYGAVWAATQNMMLAARALGIAATPTTLTRLFEGDVRALLGYPEHVETVTLLAVGRPASPFGAPRRDPVEAVAHADGWGRPVAP